MTEKEICIGTDCLEESLGGALDHLMYFVKDPDEPLSLKGSRLKDPFICGTQDEWDEYISKVKKDKDEYKDHPKTCEGIDKIVETLESMLQKETRENVLENKDMVDLRELAKKEMRKGMALEGKIQYKHFMNEYKYRTAEKILEDDEITAEIYLNRYKMNKAKYNGQPNRKYEYRIEELQRKKMKKKKKQKSEGVQNKAERQELLEERNELLKGKISFEEKKRINEIEKKLGLQRKERMSSAFVRDNLLED